jgi:hypothetical protein
VDEVENGEGEVRISMASAPVKAMMLAAKEGLEEAAERK